MNQKYKKFLTAATSVSLVAASVSPIGTVNVGAEKIGFTDVSETHDHAEAIWNLVERGIVKGYSDGTFKPNADVTRGQAAKILVGVLGLDTKNVVDPGFSDVSKKSDFYGPIAALKAAGIIKGYSDGTFKPNAPMNRNHMAKIIAGALNLQAKSPESLPFTDVNGEYRAAIAALYEHGITTGVTETTFSGKSSLTRGQLATFVVRAENVTAKPTPPVPQPTPDPTPSVPDPTPELQDGTHALSAFTYDENGVTVEGETFKVAQALASIFTEANKAALHNAEMTITLKDGVIVAIENLSFNNAGTLEQYVVFDAATTVGSIHIAANNVELKNVNVAKNVTVANTVTADLKLNNVNIAGELIVEEGKSTAVASLNAQKRVANTGNAVNIIMVSSSAGTIIIAHSGTSITSDQAINMIILTALVAAVTMNATVGTLSIETSTDVEISGEANIDNAEVQSPVDVTLLIIGALTALAIINQDATTTLGTDVTIQTLTLTDGRSETDAISNYSTVSSQIQIIVIPNNPVTPAPSPGGGSSGGSNTVDPNIAIKKKELQNLIESTKLDPLLYTEESLAAYNNSLVSALQTANATLTANQTAAQLIDAIAALQTAIDAAEQLLENSTLVQYRNHLTDVIEGLRAVTIEEEYFIVGSVAKYNALLTELLQAAEVYRDVEVDYIAIERYIGELVKNVYSAADQLLIPINRATTTTYDAAGVVSQLPDSVTFENDQLTIPLTFEQNVFDFYDGQDLKTAKYVNGEWTIENKLPIEVNVEWKNSSLYKDIFSTLNMVDYPNVKVSVTNFQEDFVLLEILGHNMTQLNLPSTIKLEDDGEMAYTLEKLANGTGYKVASGRYDDYIRIPYISQNRITTNNDNIIYLDDNFYIHKDYSNGPIEFLEKGTSDDVRMSAAKNVDGEWVFNKAEPVALTLPAGTFTHTFTETKAITYAFDGEGIVEGTIASDSSGNLIVTLQQPTFSSEVDTKTTLTVEMGMTKITYKKVEKEWQVENISDALQTVLSNASSNHYFAFTTADAATLTYSTADSAAIDLQDEVFEDLYNWLKELYVTNETEDFPIKHLKYKDELFSWSKDNESWENKENEHLAEVIKSSLVGHIHNGTKIPLTLIEEIGIEKKFDIEYIFVSH